jgi:hypothetical protein
MRIIDVVANPEIGHLDQPGRGPEVSGAWLRTGTARVWEMAVKASRSGV